MPHRRANIIRGRSALLLGVGRGDMRGGYAGAIRVRKLGQKGRENRRLAKVIIRQDGRVGGGVAGTRTDCWGTFAKNEENSFTGAVSTVSFCAGRTRKNAGAVGESCSVSEAT